MSDLILDSLEIKRFRAFQHLQIKKLGRVNLIVGKNNVGKSCLLEALQIYASRARSNIIWQILSAHDEIQGDFIKIAHHLNVQVFATSHSWDCISAFQKAAQENTGDDGMLIRLEYKKSDVQAVLFDEEMLAIATRDQIEVR